MALYNRILGVVLLLALLGNLCLALSTLEKRTGALDSQADQVSSTALKAPKEYARYAALPTTSHKPRMGK